MRSVAIEIETTGLSYEDGDKIVEIGLVELNNLKPTGLQFHTYINPETNVSDNAIRVHGLCEVFLSHYPTFSDKLVFGGILQFLGDARIIGFNVEFTRQFLNDAFAQVGLPALPSNRFDDLLLCARKLMPGSPNNFDSLVDEFSNAVDLKYKNCISKALKISEIYREIFQRQN